MNPLATAAATAAATVAASTTTASAPGLSINFFWVIVAALNFIVFLALIWRFGFDPIAEHPGPAQSPHRPGAGRRRPGSQGSRRRRSRARPGDGEARREAQALVAAAQKSAQELRDADIAATREELERLREKAAADIAAERDRALADLRAQVADLALAAAGKVVGETMTDARQRRLVEEFLADRAVTAEGRKN